MKTLLTLSLFIFYFSFAQSQQIKKDSLYVYNQPAEILYEPGLNVDSVDKSSALPRLLFVPEKNISEFNMLWSGHNFYKITAIMLSDELLDDFKRKVGKK